MSAEEYCRKKSRRAPNFAHQIPIQSNESLETIQWSTAHLTTATRCSRFSNISPVWVTSFDRRSLPVSKGNQELLLQSSRSQTRRTTSEDKGVRFWVRKRSYRPSDEIISRARSGERNMAPIGPFVVRKHSHTYIDVDHVSVLSAIRYDTPQLLNSLLPPLFDSSRKALRLEHRNNFSFLEPQLHRLPGLKPRGYFYNVSQ